MKVIVFGNVSSTPSPLPAPQPLGRLGHGYIITISNSNNLIDLLEEAEDLSAASRKSISEVLYSLFQLRYPHVTVGRPQRLYDAAKRVAGPTHSSLRGAKCLAKVYDQVENNKSPSWYLRGIPDYGFYQDLHKFLKKWPHTQNSTEVAIGKFYSVIDLNLRNKGLRPDNAYRFVDRLVSSKCSCDSVLKYGLDADANLQTQVKECIKFTQTLITELEVKRQRDEAEKKLSSTQVTLKEALDEVKLGMTLILATLSQVSSSRLV
uniref:Uncharacterized protein n=1 Tax=Amphimedon queenslandica TaxID=400682 RepID=A0A1X7VSI2_AMPQE